MGLFCGDAVDRFRTESLNLSRHLLEHFRVHFRVHLREHFLELRFRWPGTE